VKSPLSLLAGIPDSHMWSSRTWTDYAELPHPEQVLAMLPLFGFADWGLGRPLELEEILGTAVINHARETGGPVMERLHILPPLRQVLGPYPHSLFGIDFETALDLIDHIARGVAAAGLSRLLLFTTSPWNEELIDVAGRQARVRHGLQVFLSNLAALGLDLHPVRSPAREIVQCAACACLGELPAKAPPRAAPAYPAFRPGEIPWCPPLKFDMPLERAIATGRANIADAGTRLAAIVAEILDTPPRPRRKPPARNTPSNHGNNRGRAARHHRHRAS